MWKKERTCHALVARRATADICVPDCTLGHREAWSILAPALLLFLLARFVAPHTALQLRSWNRLLRIVQLMCNTVPLNYRTSPPSSCLGDFSEIPPCIFYTYNLSVSSFRLLLVVFNIPLMRSGESTTLRHLVRTAVTTAAWWASVSPVSAAPSRKLWRNVRDRCAAIVGWHS